MAIALEIGVGDLLTELLTDAFVVLGALHATGAVATLGLEAVLYHFYYFFVIVQSNLRLHDQDLRCILRLLFAIDKALIRAYN